MRIAIVEDSRQEQIQLSEYIMLYFRGREQEVSVSLFSDGDEILEGYSANYDLIFLDIQMKRLDGLRTAEEIRRLDEDVHLIFITNMAHFAIRGYSVNALDFVLKPVNYLLLKQLLARVEKLLESRERKYIALPTQNGMARIAVSQIYYLETEKHNVTIYTQKGVYRLRESMRNMEQMLSGYAFFRCNSCYLVNLDHVEKVEDNAAFVAGNALAISRPRYKEFMQALTKHIGGIKA